MACVRVAVSDLRRAPLQQASPKHVATRCRSSTPLSDPRTPSRGRRVALETAAVTPDGSHVFRAQGRLRDGPVKETAIGTVVARPEAFLAEYFGIASASRCSGKIINRPDAVRKSRERNGRLIALPPASAHALRKLGVEAHYAGRSLTPSCLASASIAGGTIATTSPSIFSVALSS